MPLPATYCATERGNESTPDIPSVKEMRLIASLHDEVLYVLTDVASAEGLGDGVMPGEVVRNLLERPGAKVCLGPTGSGVQLWARLVLGGLRPSDSCLFEPASTSEMLPRLENGGFTLAFAAGTANGGIL